MADKEDIRVLTVRVPTETLKKFKTVAASNGRAMIREAAEMIKEAVRQYEKKNGPIDISNQK